ncbi:MAG: alanyl-tRNA editing protein [Candidatus Micrarchaeota archaeon]|nr:alanyl-tRNA editing protein [Candidatus Micrarchaeota archaeon]
MTEKVYLKDSYAKELRATVTAANGAELEFDRTIFYPTGGGQPCDLGKILINGKEHGVVDVKKSGDNVIHVLEAPAEAKAGDGALLKIDWDRRYGHMRHHTALHILDGILETGRAFDNSAGGSITGGQIYHDRARIDLEIANCTKELVQLLIDTSQRYIDEGHAVTAKMLTKDQALAVPNLARTAPGRELLNKLTEVRVIELEGLDFQLDGGTHVANTREIGRITLKNYENKGSKRKRIEISVG